MLDKISLKDKKVLLRVDYNVPINHSEVMDDYRIKKTIPTINYCLEQGASLTIMSHLGRPAKYDEDYSLYPVSEKLQERSENNNIQRVLLQGEGNHFCAGGDVKSLYLTKNENH